ARGEDPRPDAHRRGDLEDAEHVQEPLRPAEVGDEERRADDVAGEAEVRACLRERLVPGSPGGEPHDGRRPGETAGEEVERDLRLPDRLLEDRAAVVGANLAHRRRPRNEPTMPATIAPAATSAVRHIPGRWLVVTT